jgi:ATPase subunit of ABC transporter with duplicated ATPase domains
MPRPEDIIYLEQCYSSLDDTKTVLETLTDLSFEKTYAEIRDFLFMKNEEVNKKVFALSGGEKARLSLVKTALQTPRLLLIDEITNNIDLRTKEPVTLVLEEYPGAMMINFA